jgi:hypothetical protein
MTSPDAKLSPWLSRERPFRSNVYAEDRNNCCANNNSEELLEGTNRIETSDNRCDSTNDNRY